MTIDRIFIGKAAKNGLEDGGPGSGNFGHKGRPGLVGGSGKGGGKAYRTASSESASGYVGVQRAKEFRGIADSARKQKTAAGFIKSLTPAQRTQIDNQRQSCGTQESFDQYAERLHRLMSGRPLTTVPTPPKHVTAQGQNIEGKWKRNKDAFQHEINDVIHAQGFDGLPQVVGRKEFEAAVKASKFIAQRSYTGQNLDEANQFRDQLFHGDWYVSCSNGGAQYGQGMYCAADYTGTLSDGIKEEMRHYRAQWQGMLGGSGRSQWGLAQDAFNKAWAEGVGKVTQVPGIHPGKIAQYFGLVPSFLSKLEEREIRFWAGSNPKEAAQVHGELKTLVDNCNKARDQIANMTSEEFEAFNKRNTPTSYTETFTLTPDAKVVKYDDIWKEYTAYSQSQPDYTSLMGKSTIEVLKEMFGNEAVENEYKQMLFLYRRASSVRARNRLRKMAEANGIEYDNGYPKLKAIIDKVEERYNEYRRSYVTNVGSFAAMRGYDAINAEGHGESDSYTVILNRTKCIFLDPKESYEEAA